MTLYKKASYNEKFSKWLVKEIDSLTGSHSRPFIRNRLPKFDTDKMKKWVEKEKPDLNSMSIFDVIREMKEEKKSEKD